MEGFGNTPTSSNSKFIFEVSLTAVNTQVYINKNFQRKIVNIFFPTAFSICFGCSKEPSHRDGSFEYHQIMFWLRNKKI